MSQILSDLSVPDGSNQPSWSRRLAVKLRVNGQPYIAEDSPRATLLDWLREDIGGLDGLDYLAHEADHLILARLTRT